MIINKSGVFTVIAALFLASAAPLPAQQTAAPAQDAVNYPPWIKNARHIEIIAFGVFPFSIFIAQTAVDLGRMAAHDWNMQYAPWPLKPAGAVGMTEDEKLATLGVAAGICITAAVVDFVIYSIKKRKNVRRNVYEEAGSPILTRTSIAADADPPEAEGALQERGAEDGGAPDGTPESAGGAVGTIGAGQGN